MELSERIEVLIIVVILSEGVCGVGRGVLREGICVVIVEGVRAGVGERARYLRGTIAAA